MPVYNKLKSVRKLSNSSLTSIIDITNLNFSDLSSATLEFLNKIAYNETENSLSVNAGSFESINVTDLFSLKLDGISTFTIDSLGRANGQELLVKVAETRRLRLTDFNDWPEAGIPGEIIYTGVQNQKPQFGEDVICYLQSRGWVSLTEPGTASFITLYELEGSPPIPACPEANTGIIWVGPPGYETGAVPSTQTLYYIDENCNIYDLTKGNCEESCGVAEPVTEQDIIVKSTAGQLTPGKNYLVNDSNPFPIVTPARTTTDLSKTGTIMDANYAGTVNYDPLNGTMSVVSAKDSSTADANLYLGADPSAWSVGAGSTRNTFNTDSSGTLGINSIGNTFKQESQNNTLGAAAQYNTFDQKTSGFTFGNNLAYVTIESGAQGADYTASPAYDFLYNKTYSARIFSDGTDNYYSYYDTTKDQIVLTNLSTLTTSYIGAPASPNKSVQFNNNGVFGGSSNFTFDSATNNLALTGTVDVTGAYIKLEHTLNSGMYIASRNLSNGASAYSLVNLQGGASTNGIENGIFVFNRVQTINPYLRSSSLYSTVASDLGNTGVAKQVYYIASANSGSQFEWHYNTSNPGLGAGTLKMYLTSNGALWTNSSVSATALTIRNTPTANPSGTQMLVRNTSTGAVEHRTYGGLFAQTAQSAAIAATTAETSLLGAGVGSLSVPANGFTVGDSFHAKLFGEISSANSETIQIKVKSGSVILADFGAYSLPSIANKVWELDITFTIRSIGAAGVASIATNGTFSFTHGGGNTFETKKINTVNSTTFDTTASNTLDITLQWGSTNATNTIHSDQSILTKIY